MTSTADAGGNKVLAKFKCFTVLYADSNCMKETERDSKIGDQ